MTPISRQLDASSPVLLRRSPGAQPNNAFSKTDNGGPLAPGRAVIAGEPHGRRSLRRAARTSVCHEFLVDQGLHATAGLYVRLLCEVGCRLLRGAGVHGRSCSARRRALPFGGLCLRLCSPLSRRPFRRCARAGSAHHAFGGYLVKVYAWKSILGADRTINTA